MKWVEKFGDEPFLNLLDKLGIPVDDKTFSNTDYTVCPIHEIKYLNIRGGIKCCKDCLTASINDYLIAQALLDKMK